MKCIVCNKELSGKQTKYCSNICNHKYNDSKNPRKEYKNQWYNQHYKKLTIKKELYAKEHGFKSLNQFTYLHKRIRKIKPKQDFCTICNNKKKLELASINHIYTEDPNDYLWLCRSCHYLFDKLSKLIIIEGDEEE